MKDNTLRILVFFSTRAAASQAEPQATSTTSGLIDQLTVVQNQFAEASHLVYVRRYDVNPTVSVCDMPFDLAVMIGRTDPGSLANVAALGRPVLEIVAEKPQRPISLPAYGACAAEEAYAAAQELRRRYAQVLATFASLLPGIVVSKVPEPLLAPAPPVRSAPPAPGAPGDGNGSGTGDGDGEGAK
jgi:hypothetical protein